MVNRYQEPYLFALSPISCMRSFTWTLEDKGTQESRQLKCHHTSPHVKGVMGFGSTRILLSIQQRYENK